MHKACDFVRYRSKMSVCVCVQLFIAGLIALLCLLFFGKNVSYSLCLGWASWMFPSLYFISKMLKMATAPQVYKSPSVLLQKAYRFEIAKLLFSICSIILFLLIVSMHQFAFLVGYILAVVSMLFLQFFVVMGSSINGHNC